MPAGLPVGDLIVLVDWPFKFVEGPSTAARLFDLAIDPGELNNLADAEPGCVGRMREMAREAGGPTSSRTPGIDAREAERLRALGYVR